MIVCKQDILKLLKDHGYSTYRLRKEKILGESVLQRYRNGKLPSRHELDIICRLTNCSVADIIEYVPDN